MNIEEAIQVVSSLNWQTIIGMFAISWYFTRDIKQSIEKIDADFKMMNTRISRVEGTVYGKDIYNKIDSE